MRDAATIALPLKPVELVPDDYFAPLDLTAVFPRRAPLEVDMGCGDGSFLAAIAAENPDRNFLGIERMAGRVRSACGKIARRQLSNARVLRVEACYGVNYLLPAGSVRRFHLLFPDPWPKRRHQRRRLVTPVFCTAIHRALEADGIFSVATDEHAYFEEIHQTCRTSHLFTTVGCTAELTALQTTFEQHFNAIAAPIYRLVLRKISPDT